MKRSTFFGFGVAGLLAGFTLLYQTPRNSGSNIKRGELAQKIEQAGLPAPPKVYNVDEPLRSGGFVPDPLPESYIGETPEATFSLDELVEDKTNFPDLVKFYPQDLSGARYIFGEFTASEWCPNCVFIDKQGLEEKIIEYIEKKHKADVGFAKAIDPGEGDRPAVLKKFDGVPNLVFYEVRDRNLHPLGEVDGSGPGGSKV